MKAHQVFTRAELVWIHCVQQSLDSMARPQVLTVELGCHLAPDFSTRDLCDEASLLQVEPVSLKKFWPNLFLENIDPFVLPHECRREAELAP